MKDLCIIVNGSIRLPIETIINCIENCSKQFSFLEHDIWCFTWKTPENIEENLKPSASLIVSSLGRGRVIMFADNPNFRGAWYGTNKLFLNALFLGNHISVPRERNN